MAKKPGKSKPAAKRTRAVRTPANPASQLARLPRNADLVITGGRRTLAAMQDEHGHEIHPQVILWMSEEDQMIFGLEVVPLELSPDEGITEAVDALIEGLRKGGQPPTVPMGLPLAQPPALPGSIVVTDAALADGVRKRLGSLEISIEVQTDNADFEEFMNEMLASMGISADGKLPPPFSWEIAPAVIKPLYAAAKVFWKLAPWDYLFDYPPLAVMLGEHGPAPEVPTLYASVMGAEGKLSGVVCYYSLAAFEETAMEGLQLLEQEQALVDSTIAMMRQQGLPVDSLPPEALQNMIMQMMGEQFKSGAMAGMVKDALFCLFDDLEEADPTYVAWLEAHGFKPSQQGIPVFQRTIGGGETRPPDEREARALNLTLEALNQFFSAKATALKAGPPIGVPIVLATKVGAVHVAVEYTPAEEEAEEEEFELDIPAGAETTLFRLQVKLDAQPKVWRRIELLGDHTLFDLHLAIQQAFGWDNDHLYAFYMSGKPFDTNSEYDGDPLGGGAANEIVLASLELRANKTFLYIFDFGDEIRHRIKVEAITPDGVDPQAIYPRVTESEGEAPEQYPGAEDFEDEEEEDDNEEVQEEK